MRDNPQNARFRLLKDRGLVVFLVCAVLFHFANAAMLPLLGEVLAKGHGRASMMFMSACVVTTQLVGILYTLTSSAPLLIGIQVLDGIGAGIFGVVGFLFLAAVAFAALAILYFWMPETRELRGPPTPRMG